MIYISVFVLLLLGAVAVLGRLRGPAPAVAPVGVKLGEDSVTLAGVGVSARTVQISGLRAVDIFTTDQGPFVEDVFWVLTPASGAPLVVPSGAEGIGALVDRLLDLEGFDHESVGVAMGSTDNARFPCWRALDPEVMARDTRASSRAGRGKGRAKGDPRRDPR